MGKEGRGKKGARKDGRKDRRKERKERATIEREKNPAFQKLLKAFQ